MLILIYKKFKKNIIFNIKFTYYFIKYYYFIKKMKIGIMKIKS